MPDTVHRPTALLRAMLEESLHTHTIWLTELTRHGRPAGTDEYHHDVLDALITAARQGVTDTTRALHRMAEGRYGICEACGHDIPLGRLRAAPDARFCTPCGSVREPS
ncbi:TraR/DksA family transcriptional regulator [Jidongwangia harbinensis]|uniref:TraR/DksA family transcriptional regulator n=1 Tax=Jidongwangia harbinensis TaxID=2878561 RepID=UPI001CD955C5|nr:TraR/DksA C4-type zinc finger protein [Jidongwangia harbinensis]MCA2214365.1 TraR/DksA C4-type zinc finger protein [Jidongwangia harbinensis]